MLLTAPGTRPVQRPLNSIVLLEALTNVDIRRKIAIYTFGKGLEFL